MEVNDVRKEEAEELKLKEAEKQLTPKQLKFVQIWKLGNVHPRLAMKEAGYSEKTILKQGPSWVLKNPAVKEYVRLLGDTKLDAIVGSVKAQFLRLEYSLSVAMDTVTELAESAQDEGTRLRAAKALLDLGKGILLATIPQKRMDFSVLMRDLYQEAVSARASETEDLRPYVDPNRNIDYIDVEDDIENDVDDVDEEDDE